jgi:hypothetical protein
MARINLDQLANRVLHDKSAARKSQQWFDAQVKYLGDAVSPNAVMSNNKRKRNFLLPGYMHMYFYYPKGADTLPYYDTFPLIFPFAKDNETFTGINFHYLPTKVRVVLLKNLLDFATDRKLDENTKLKLSWQYVAGVSKYRGVSAAVKKYRYDQVQSSFLFVPADQWFNAVMLPFERFRTGVNETNYSKQTVWRDSLGKA